MINHRFPIALVAFLLALLAPVLAASAEDHERWYVVKMLGQRAGWMHTSQTTLDGRITTSSTMKLSLRRGEASIVIEIDSLFVETVDGKPVSARNTMKMASQPTTTEYLFEGDIVKVSRSAGGRPDTKVETEEPLPAGEWLTPAAAEVYGRKRYEAGAQEFTIRMLDVSQGLRAISTTTKVLEKLNVEALGKTVPGIKVLSTTDFAPGIETISFADERGVLVRSETKMGEIQMDIILADKDLAQAEVDAPELMASTLVEPKGNLEKLKEPRSLRQATYILRLKERDLAELPTGGAQRVERIDASSLRVRIDVDDIAPAPEADAGLVEFRQPSQMIESEDEVVARLTRDALKGIKESDHEARVEALRKFVFRHIKDKNFGVGFATAAEVARTCSGDCSEHAALLTAMLRNAGYASRTASGLVYVDQFAGKSGIFGYHMWSQVLLERGGAQRWVDLDATLPGGRSVGPGGFDATHIVLAHSSMSDGQSMNELVVLAPLIGALEITVE